MAKSIDFIVGNKSAHPLHEAIYRINVGLNLPRQLAFDALSEALHTKGDEARAISLGILLNGLMAKGPTLEELGGVLNAFLVADSIDPLTLRVLDLDKPVVGLAGSGKKGIKTFNVSSAAGFVAASMGVYVAKNCAGSTSSVTGSADLAEIAGANLSVASEQMIDIMQKTGIGFFKIEEKIPKVDAVYNGRFYAPHVLSFALPALVMPFRPDSFLYGLAHPNVELSARALRMFGFENSMVVSTTDDGVHFLDEIGIFGTVSIIGNKNGVLGNLVTIQPGSILGFSGYTRESIAPMPDKYENIKVALNVLRGNGMPAHRDIVAVNAATILFLAGKIKTLDEGYSEVKNFLKTGEAYHTFERFVKATGGTVHANLL